MWTKPYDSLPD